MSCDKNIIEIESGKETTSQLLTLRLAKNRDSSFRTELGLTTDEAVTVERRHYETTAANVSPVARFDVFRIVRLYFPMSLTNHLLCSELSACKSVQALLYGPL